MSGSTEFLPFATGGGANVASQAAYATDAATSAGFSAGIARSANFNKALRQATFVSAGIANWMANVLSISVPDDGNLSGFVTTLGSALATAGYGTYLPLAGGNMTGPLRIGTASAPGTSTSAAHLTGDISLYGSAETIHFNGYFNGGWRYRASGQYAAALRYDATIGQLQLFLSPSTGAADAVYSPNSILSISGSYISANYTIQAPTFTVDGNMYCLISGGNPTFNLDTNDYKYYDRAANTFGWVIAGTLVAAMNASVLDVKTNITINGAQVWTSANGGAGSALDAGLWWGKNPAQFFTTYFGSGSNTNGHYAKRPDGAGGVIVDQWGSVAGPWNSETTVAVTFPVPFSATPPIDAFQVAAVITNSTSIGDMGVQIIASSISTTGFTIQLQSYATGASTHLDNVTWRAIGAG